ncbi:MAG: hypothetical protein AAF591_21225 [Verrucomicrobiota bacterium]
MKTATIQVLGGWRYPTTSRLGETVEQEDAWGSLTEEQIARKEATETRVTVTVDGQEVGLIAYDQKEVFERAGVTFGEGSFAWWLPLLRKMVVRLPESELELIEAYVGSVSMDVPRSVKVRATCLAYDDVDFGASVLKEQPLTLDDLIEAGRERVEVVDEVNVMMRSGQRAKNVNGSLKKNDTRGFSSLEVDPHIGPDGRTVDLNFVYEIKRVIPLAGEGEGGADGRTEREVFIAHEVTTSVTLQEGYPALIELGYGGARDPRRYFVAIGVYLVELPGDGESFVREVGEE